MDKQGGFLISQISKLSARIFEKMLRESGVEAFNGAQGRILFVLWQEPQLSITEIAQKTSLAKTSLTSMLDRMEESGLIIKETDPANRRQVNVCITKKAKAYQSEYDAVSQRMNALFYEGFSPDEIAAFEQKLYRIKQNLESGWNHECKNQ